MTDKQHCDGLGGPTSDDEPIEYVPNRRAIITAGNCAAAGTGAARTGDRAPGRPDAKTRPRGVFSLLKGTGRASGAISMSKRPHPLISQLFLATGYPDFLGFQRRLAHELEERRALVGLVRVRPAEENLLGPQGRGRP